MNSTSHSPQALAWGLGVSRKTETVSTVSERSSFDSETVKTVADLYCVPHPQAEAWGE